MATRKHHHLSPYQLSQKSRHSQRIITIKIRLSKQANSKDKTDAHTQPQRVRERERQNMSVKPTPTNEKRVVVDMRYIIYANNGDDDDRRHFQVLSFRTWTVIIFSALHHHFSLLICRVRRAAHFHLCTWCSCIVWPQPFNTILTIRNMNNKEMEKNIITKINKRQIEIGEPQRQTTSMIIIHAYIYLIFVSVACAFVKLQFVASITINKTFSHFPKKKK